MPRKRAGAHQPSVAHHDALGRPRPAAAPTPSAVVDHPLCHFVFLGNMYELRFHPRADLGSPMSVVEAAGARRARHYLAVQEANRLLTARAADGASRQARVARPPSTPFDDFLFRLVLVGEALPRPLVRFEGATWCMCPRVEGAHPVYFCNRITQPNWMAYWAWQREVAAHLLRDDALAGINPAPTAHAPDTDKPEAGGNG